MPVRAAGDSDKDRTRRVLLIWQRSVAPNSFALGLDQERNVMIVHHLVRPDPGR